MARHGGFVTEIDWSLHLTDCDGGRSLEHGEIRVEERSATFVEEQARARRPSRESKAPTGGITVDSDGIAQFALLSNMYTKQIGVSKFSISRQMLRKEKSHAAICGYQAEKKRVSEKTDEAWYCR